MATVGTKIISISGETSGTISAWRGVQYDTTSGNEDKFTEGRTNGKLVGVYDKAVDAAAGDLIDVTVQGTAYIVCGQTVAQGDRLTVNSSGQAMVTVSAGDPVIGVALESGVQNGRVLIVVNPTNY